MWIPFDIADIADWIDDLFDDWQLSMDWGNVATVAVATIAIFVNAYYNRRTLRLSAGQFGQTHQHALDAFCASQAQFEETNQHALDTLAVAKIQFYQARQDARIDKLRAEVAAYMTALDLRSSLKDLMETAAGAERNETSAVAARTELVALFPSSADVKATYREIAGHTLTIHVLTDDETIIRFVANISSACAAEMTDWDGVISELAGTTTPINLCDNARARRPEREEREQAVEAQAGELIKYCIAKFRQT